MLNRKLLAVFILAVLNSCNTDNKEADTKTPLVVAEKDTHTKCNADKVIPENLYLDIAVDMSKRQIGGSALWTIKNEGNANELVLDSYDLSIDSVQVDGKKGTFVLDKPEPFLGSGLHIPVAAATKQVKVFYSTGEHARALQWLEPSQTNDRKHPFLYTQSEAIYARSWIPCPDGPGIRFTYSARVAVPKGLMAVMSAMNPQELSPDGVYEFSMSTPIPAYLMALAVGDIAFKAVNDRTGVYAEPGMLDKVHHEFEDIGDMVAAAEKLYGPYRWGRYDVLVLPPGFPIGGMENPRLTFCTPTVIAGDKSLVNLIAHELAHSWSGNLVTNATWNDFWLNEGFTVYFERRIMESMQGKGYADMLWELGYQDLVKETSDLGVTSRDTWLKLDLKGRDPDDGLTDIPYEKGAHFLRLIEESVSREGFDHFLSRYFDEHAFSTITTEGFLSFLDTVLLDEELRKSLNVKEWVYAPGIPANCPRAPHDRFAIVDSERSKFLSGMPAVKLAVTQWTTHEWLHFLRKMPDNFSAGQMKSLDDAFNLSKTGNSEIADLWFIMAVRSGYKAAYPEMELFLSRVGRRKFLEPLYKEMMKSSSNATLAKSLYARFRKNYHPIAQETLDKIVNQA